MKRHLNTLFVTTQGTYLSRDGEAVRVRVNKETRLRVPIHNLGSIVCFGRVSCSPGLMDLCGKAGVSLSFMSAYGRFIARVQGPVSGNVLLRREQYRRADDHKAAAAIARSVLVAKIANSRTVLQRALRDRPEMPGADALQSAVRRLGSLMTELKSPLTLDSARGVEGDAARTYFKSFGHLISAQKEEFFFHSRNRRPPTDNMNALLSFIYAILAHDVASGLETVGLDPAVGYLHRDRPGRPGLALDIMEEFRAFLADRLALSLVNRRQVQAKGFQTIESGAVRMNDDTRKTLLVAYQKRKQETLQHPFLGETVTVGLLFHIQARLLARHLRGDLDAYPPFIWK